LTLGAQPLRSRLQVPNVVADFDDIRPYEFANGQELFGLFYAGWRYLNDALDGGNAAWALAATTPGIEQIVNDLTEKSIRNYAIVERWNRGSP
jgi:hypothetical protein